MIEPKSLGTFTYLHRYSMTFSSVLKGIIMTLIIPEHKMIIQWKRTTFGELLES